MTQLFANAARTELNAAITAADVTFALKDGSTLPTATVGTGALTAGDWFKAVLQGVDGIEIVYVRTHATATTPNVVSNVMRAQEGTVARAWAKDTVLGLRMTALDFKDLADRMKAAEGQLGVNLAANYAWTGGHTHSEQLLLTRSNAMTSTISDCTLRVERTNPGVGNNFGVMRVEAPTASPGCVLFVVANKTFECFKVTADGICRVQSDLYVGGNFYGRNSSDAKLKENIEVIPGALAKVCAIGGKTFDWKGRQPGNDYHAPVHDFGVIAQDVQAVFPMAVAPREDGTLAVDYVKLVALAFQAIKELEERTLSARVGRAWAKVRSWFKGAA